jgi:protein kinase C substrate 80K-H
LAIGTIYHGSIGSDQLWQILQFILPEISESFAKSLSEKQQTCSSSLTEICPAQQIMRMIGTQQYLLPPEALLKAGDGFCAKLVDKVLQGSCTNDDDNTIPTHVPDGYYGYFTPQPRQPNDDLVKEFIALNSLQVDRSLLDELESQKKELDRQCNELEQSLRDLEDEIGGRDTSRLGVNGELYSFKERCNSVEAGKYVYEVCIFGSAKQKEKDGEGTGTNLGTWEGIFVDEETHERVMKWTNGAQCWNGPQRSAVVHVTCGPENKILSAEEPETCLYSLQMESFIACDDDFKARHGL